jgi:O-acetylhomoserine (thiol)-lyase
MASRAGQPVAGSPAASTRPTRLPSQKATLVSSETNADSETDSDPTAHWSFETKQIHAGQQPDPTTNARALPIYQTTSYVFDDTAHAAALFGLEIPGNIYTRIGNPTTDVVEQRIAALEGGVAALFLSSGQAAETFAILNLAGAGDHIVSSPRLYGGTYNLFHYSLPKLGVDVSFVDDPDDLDSWRAAVRPNTKAFFAETISNPQIDVLDTPGVSGVAHQHGVPLIVDNTVATPYLIQPIAQGADIVVHSATKYLGGHGAAIAGVIVDGGTFDWTQDGFPGFTTPDPSYHGVVYAELGPPAFAVKARVQLLRDYGSAASPFNAFLVAQGLETLSLRIERHVANAQRVAEFLAGHDDVLSVNYAGLPSSPWYERAKKLAPKGPGAVLSFELAGGVEAGKAFVNALKLHSHVANIGDVRSLVIHPASTTHSQLSPAEQLSTGVSPGLVRLAVGIEGIDDILADLELGFAAARKYRGAAASSGDPHAVAAF